jgi:hypothetical protein
MESPRRRRRGAGGGIGNNHSRLLDLFTPKPSQFQYLSGSGSAPGDDRLAELFVSNHNANSAADAAAREPATVARSLCNSGPTSTRSARHYAGSIMARRAVLCG